MGSAPTSITMPPGTLRFSVTTSVSTSPLSATPTLSSVSSRARFNYFDGAGKGFTIQSPNSDQIAANSWTTAGGLPLMTESMIYSVPATGNTYSRTFSSSYGANTFVQPASETIVYQDSGMNVSYGSYNKIYTSGPLNGKAFESGVFTGSALYLTPLTPAMLAGKTVTMNNQCGSNSDQPNVYVFSADGTSATATCSAKISVSTTAIPGIVLMTDSAGTMTYVGLVGAGMVTGASWVVIHENAWPSNLGRSAWGVMPPFSLVK